MSTIPKPKTKTEGKITMKEDYVIVPRYSRDGEYALRDKKTNRFLFDSSEEAESIAKERACTSTILLNVVPLSEWEKSFDPMGPASPSRHAEDPHNIRIP